MGRGGKAGVCPARPCKIRPGELLPTCVKTASTHMLMHSPMYCPAASHKGEGGGGAQVKARHQQGIDLHLCASRYIHPGGGTAAPLTAVGHPFLEQEDVSRALVHPHLHRRERAAAACERTATKTHAM